MNQKTIGRILHRINVYRRSIGVLGLLKMLYHKNTFVDSGFSPSIRELVENRVGFEIGGASQIFTASGLLPVYPLAQRVDNCNYSASTIWKQNVEGDTFVFDETKPPGHQYILEGTNLDQIQDHSYDFVLSSHTLEHMANPLKALIEWKRILYPNGLLFLVLPHKDMTFDHQRPITTLDLLIRNYEKDIGEDDLSQLDEVMELHDFQMEPSGLGPKAFKERALRILETRGLHQHVYVARLVAEILDFTGYQILFLTSLVPGNIIAIAQLPSTVDQLENSVFLSNSPEYQRNSPFRSDKYSFV